MTDYTSNLKTWGDVGSEYPDSYSYTKGEPPVDEWDDFFNFNVEKDLSHLITLTNKRIETAKGGASSFPANPEASHLYHNQDGESLHFWNATGETWHRLLAADGDKMEGALDMGGYSIYDSTGPLSVGGDLEVQNGTVEAGVSIQNAFYDSEGDVPSLSEGEMVYVDGEGLVFEGDSAIPDPSATALQDHLDDETNPHNITDVENADTVDGKHAHELAGMSLGEVEAVAFAYDLVIGY